MFQIRVLCAGLTTCGPFPLEYLIELRSRDWLLSAEEGLVNESGPEFAVALTGME